MSLKGPKVSTAKCQIGAFDASKASISQFAANGLLTNPGISIFGESLQFGVVRAGVTIGPPQAIPGVTLPFSLEVSGISQYFGIVNVFGAINQFGLKTAFGATIKNGFSFKNAIDLKNAINIGNGPIVFNSRMTANGGIKTPVIVAEVARAELFSGDVSLCKGVPAGCKSTPFDMPHWKQKGKRIRHVCTEGPEAGIYIRGRLKDSNVIELPEYWDGLVDYDSISVQLQPIGDRHYHINVIEIDKEKVVVKEADDKPFECFYHVWVARWVNPITQEKLHVVYDGMSPDDYPGDNTGFVIGGWDYDRRQTQWPHHLEEDE